MRSLEEKAIEVLTQEDEYVGEILRLVERRARGEKVDLNKEIDLLHDSSTTAVSQRNNSDDLSDFYHDQQSEDEAFGDSGVA